MKNAFINYQQIKNTLVNPYIGTWYPPKLFFVIFSSFENRYFHYLLYRLFPVKMFGIHGCTKSLLRHKAADTTRVFLTTLFQLAKCDVSKNLIFSKKNRKKKTKKTRRGISRVRNYTGGESIQSAVLTFHTVWVSLVQFPIHNPTPPPPPPFEVPDFENRGVRQSEISWSLCI